MKPGHGAGTLLRSTEWEIGKAPQSQGHFRNSIPKQARGMEKRTLPLQNESISG